MEFRLIGGADGQAMPDRQQQGEGGSMPRITSGGSSKCREEAAMPCRKRKKRRGDASAAGRRRAEPRSSHRATSRKALPARARKMRCPWRQAEDRRTLDGRRQIGAHQDRRPMPPESATKLMISGMFSRARPKGCNRAFPRAERENGRVKEGTDRLGGNYADDQTVRERGSRPAPHPAGWLMRLSRRSAAAGRRRRVDEAERIGDGKTCRIVAT